MKTSESTGEIFKALVEAAAELGMVAKTGRMTEGARYDFASIDDYEKVWRPVLTKHGLTVTSSVFHMQELDPGEYRNGTKFYRHEIGMQTRAIHSSGEWLEVTSYGVGFDTSDKGPGKAQTYARKYGVAGLLGLSTSDDVDGSDVTAGQGQAQKPAATPPARKAATRKKAAKPAEKPAQAPATPPPGDPPRDPLQTINSTQGKALWTAWNARLNAIGAKPDPGIRAKALKEVILEGWGFESSATITQEKYPEILQAATTYERPEHGDSDPEPPPEDGLRTGNDDPPEKGFGPDPDDPAGEIPDSELL